MNIHLRLSAIFGLVGLGLSLVAGIAYGRDQAFTSRAERAEGVVTAVETVPFRKGLRVTIEFTIEGRRIRFPETISSSHPTRQVGERVQVLFDPGVDPEDAMVDSFWNHHLLTVIFGAIGGPFLAASMVLALVALVRKRAAPQATR